MATSFMSNLKKGAFLAGAAIAVWIGASHFGKSETPTAAAPKKTPKNNIEWMLNQDLRVPEKTGALWDLSKNPKLSNSDRTVRTIYLDNLKRRLEVYFKAKSHAKGKKAVEKAFTAERFRYMQDCYNEGTDSVSLRNFQINEMAYDKLQEIFKEIEGKNKKGPEIAYRNAMLEFGKLVDSRYAENERSVRSGGNLNETTDTRAEKASTKSTPSTPKEVKSQGASGQASGTQTASVESQAAKAKRIADKIAASQVNQGVSASVALPGNTSAQTASTTAPKANIVATGEMDVVVPVAGSATAPQQTPALATVRVQVVQDDQGRVFMKNQPRAAIPVHDER